MRKDERLKNREIMSRIRKCLTEVCREEAATAWPNVHYLDKHLWFSLCVGVQGMELFVEFFFVGVLVIAFIWRYWCT